MELSQKPYFLAHIERFFIYALLCPASYAPSFRQNRGLVKLHNRGKFRKYTICDCQIINFPRFSYHPWNGTFLGVLMLFLSQIQLDFAEIFIRSILSLNKHSVWRIFQNFEFFPKRDISKVYSFALFFGPI